MVSTRLGTELQSILLQFTASSVAFSLQFLWLWMFGFPDIVDEKLDDETKPTKVKCDADSSHLA